MLTPLLFFTLSPSRSAFSGWFSAPAPFISRHGLPLVLFVALCGGCASSSAQTSITPSQARTNRSTSQRQQKTGTQPARSEPTSAAIAKEDQSSPPKNWSVFEDGPIVQKTINFGDQYTDLKVYAAFSQLLASYPQSRFVILVTKSTGGVCADARKYVYDRQSKDLLFLHSDVCNNLLGPQESHVWRRWRGVEASDLAERIPWWDERFQTDKSTPGQDGRNSVPVSYPDQPQVTAWPMPGIPTASTTRGQ